MTDLLNPPKPAPTIIGNFDMTDNDKAREIAKKHIELYRTMERGIGDTVYNAVTEALESQRRTIEEKDGEIDRLKPLAAIGEKWQANSDLSEWFPYTALEMVSIKNDVMEKAAKIEKLGNDLVRTENCFSAAHSRAEQLQSRVKELEECLRDIDSVVDELITPPGNGATKRGE